MPVIFKIGFNKLDVCAVTMDLLGLPVVMIENIFSYLSYDEIAKNRLVSDYSRNLLIEMRLFS